MKDRYPGYRQPRSLKTTAAIAGAAIALAACSSTTASPRPSNSENSTSASAEPVPGCQPDVTLGSTVTISSDPAKATPLSVLAGIVRFPNGELIGRPVYVRENGQWDLATIRHLGSGAWQLASPMPIKGVIVYTREVVNPLQDGCVPVANFDRQPQAQIVTTSGTVTDTSSTPAQEYANFNDGDQNVTSPFAAYNEGAIGVPMPTPPPGFHQVTLSNQQ